ncbi:MAG: flagellar hook protein FlgE [Firmicutes bacterium]|nr:flagellar hook protein FlgE [Bacillota bacterium]
MSGSMYAAISGLNADQALLGIVAQNIANADTVGYKSSSMNFAEAMQQTLSGASAPTATSGGINPIQESAGGAVNVAGVQINTTEGTLQSTGINTNLAIQGAGYFIVRTPQGGLAYTRAGDFSLDANGNLVDPNGDLVLGWSAATVQANGQTAGNLVPLSVPPNLTEPATASTAITSISGNLDSQDKSDSIPVTLYDSQGNEVPVDITFTNPTATANGMQWTVGYSYQPPNSTTPQTGTLGTLLFSNTTGQATYTGTGSITISGFTDGAAPLTVTLNQAAFANLTGYAMTTNMTITANGNPAGTLENFTIGADGEITGSFSNGQTAVLGQVALANFANPGGLLNIGNTLWQQSANSGPPVVGAPSSGQLGSLAAGELEGSNVSLANQFVNMIIAQEGYQANSKVISVAQTLDTTLVNMIQP